MSRSCLLTPTSQPFLLQLVIQTPSRGSPKGVRPSEYSSVSYNHSSVGTPSQTHTPKLKPRNGKSFLPNEFSLV